MWPLDCFYLIALFSRFTYSYLPALSIRQSHPCLLWTAVPVSTSPLKIFLLRDIFYWSLNLIVVLRSSNYKGRQRVKSRVQTCACMWGLMVMIVCHLRNVLILQSIDLPHGNIPIATLFFHHRFFITLRQKQNNENKLPFFSFILIFILSLSLKHALCFISPGIHYERRNKRWHWSF